MKTPVFPNTILEAYEYVETNELDEYDEPITEYVFKTSTPADIQPLTPNDSMHEYGKILEDTYKVYIPSDISIEDTDIIKFENDKSTYKIIGSVSKWNHILQHNKIIIQKQRIPSKVIKDV